MGPVIVLLAFYFNTQLQKKISNNISDYKKESIYIPPPQYIEKMTFGFNEIISDVLWLRWIQNFEVCGKELEERSKTIKNKYSKEDVGSVLKNLDLTQKKQICSQGWSYQMLDAVTKLSPRFKPPYSMGASTLSVLAEDHVGAKKIYDKAVIQYPNDWAILYRAAYHYIYELNDYENGSLLLKQAVDNGAPSWLYSLSSRISTLAGKIEFGVTVLKQYLETLTDVQAREEVVERIEELKKKIVEEQKNSK